MQCAPDPSAAPAERRMAGDEEPPGCSMRRVRAGSVAAGTGSAGRPHPWSGPRPAPPPPPVFVSGWFVSSSVTSVPAPDVAPRELQRREDSRSPVHRVARRDDADPGRRRRIGPGDRDRGQRRRGGYIPHGHGQPPRVPARRHAALSGVESVRPPSPSTVTRAVPRAGRTWRTGGTVVRGFPRRGVRPAAPAAGKLKVSKGTAGKWSPTANDAAYPRRSGSAPGTQPGLARGAPGSGAVRTSSRPAGTDSSSGRGRQGLSRLVRRVSLPAGALGVRRPFAGAFRRCPRRRPAGRGGMLRRESP